MNFTRLNTTIDRINQLILEKENIMKELNNEIKNLKDGKKEIESYMRKYADAEAKEQELLKKYEDIDGEKNTKRTSRRKMNAQKADASVQTNVKKEQLDEQKDVEDVQTVVQNQEKVNDDLKYFNH